jgi:amino acid transporter
MLSFHQLGREWWRNLYLALVTVWSFYSLYLWQYCSGSYSLPQGLVSSKLHYHPATRRLTHCRAANGHSVDELPFKAAFGVWGSWVCLIINVLCLIAQFYVALYPVGGPNLDPTTFFELYLAGPFLVALYLGWKVYSWFVRPEDRPLYVKIKDIDIYTGMRDVQQTISGADVSEEQRRAMVTELQGEKKKRGPKEYIMAGIRNII